jgi:hypothetical protein
MRRVSVLLGSSFLLLAVIPAAGCSSSGKATQPNGPVFDLDAGSDAVTDNPPDAHFTFDAPLDHAAPGDAGSHDTGAHDAHTDGDATVGPGHDGGVDAVSADSPVANDGSGDGAMSADVGTTLDASVCTSGTGTIAIVGGTASVAFATTSKNGGAWATTTFGSSSVSAAPAIVALGSGLLSVFPLATTDYIQSTLFTPGASPAWSMPVAVPALSGSVAPAVQSGAAGLAALGADAELVYRGSNTDFYHGIYTAGAWGPANDPVMASGEPEDTGPSAPSVAVVGSTLYAAYDGNDQGLYVESWTSAGGWAGAVPIAGAGTSGVPPTLIALTSGAADLLLVFEVQTTNDLFSVTHTPGSGGGTWSAPVAVDPTANTANAVSLAPLTGGGAVMVYLGALNSFPYFSIYAPAGATPWTVPASVYPSSLALASAPTVAPGVCNVDAIAALTEPAGVEIVSLKSGAWGTPVLLGGTGATTYATIATLP